MTDSSSTSAAASPWLVDGDLRKQVAPGSGAVILNPGNASTHAKPLGACLREALQGGTEAVAVLVGYWGLNSLNLSDPQALEGDNPAAILVGEALDAADITPTGDDCVRGSVDLMVGQVTDQRASLVLRGWYWVCRWGVLQRRTRRDGRPMQTLKDVTRLRKNAAFKISMTDIEALWYEGERQGLWERGE